MSLGAVRNWVFDMDGTLTVAVHDYAAIRVALGIPTEHDILTHLAALPADEAAAKHAWLLEHERDLAVAATAAIGAVELVRELAERGCRLGILTRNARDLAQVTLEAIGLADCFPVAHILGRDEAVPAEPGRVAEDRRCLGRGTPRAGDGGDYRFDLVCGRAAGARTVLVNLPDNPWPELVDWHAADCRALKVMLG